MAAMTNALAWLVLTVAGIAAIVSLADSLVRAWHAWVDLTDGE
jgi:hypothetical protein